MGCSSSASAGNASNPQSQTSSGAAPTSKKGGVIFGYFGGLRGGPRGNSCKYLLNYCGVTYTDRKFPVEDGQKEWKAYKSTCGIPFAGLPYLTDGDY